MSASPATTAEREGGAPATRRRAEPKVVRVAQVVTKFTAGAGGIALRGALGLDPDRFSTTFLTAEGGSFIGRAEEAGFEVVRLQHMAPGRGLYPWADGKGLRELETCLSAGEFDVVHTHSAKAGGLGRLAARRVGTPAIVHSFHGFPFHEFQGPLSRRGLIALERRLARMTDYFLTDGSDVAAQAIRLRIAPPERIRAIDSPIDDIPLATPADRERGRRLIGVPLDARVVGTVARLDGQKSPLDMVKALASVQDDVRLVWVGDGELRRQTEHLARRLRVDHRVMLLGDRSDVRDILPAFDVFALSSLFEGLPCAVVEAMSCGIPVVATAVNAVPEIVVSGKTGLVAKPGDPASLGRAIAYMFDAPEDAARMAVAARAHLRGRFRPEVLGQDLTEVYDAALRLSAAAGTDRRGRRARW